MNSTDDLDIWADRIERSRRRRERFETAWQAYARMHTNAYLAVAAENDDELVNFPNGDQVKAGLVFANIEQAIAQTEVPEIGVRATATDYTRELGAEDTHREAVVEQAVWRSLMRSGLFGELEETDPIRRDGFVIGHGVCYTRWAVYEDEVETEALPVLEMAADGTVRPLLEKGIPAMRRQTEKRVVWDGCRDEQVSPLQFLFDAGAARLERSPWHGYERPVKLETLRQDPRYVIPDWVEGTSYHIKDLYQDRRSDDEAITDAVMVVTIWDVLHKELLTLIEADGKGAAQDRVVRKKPGARGLLAVAVERWPLTFSHPEASPFSFFVPIPANDHPYGISQIEHTRNSAMEADKLRTRQANITRQIKRIPWYIKGRIDADQVKQAFNGPDVTPVGIDLRDGEKPEQLFGELPAPSIAADIYRQSTVAEQSVDKVSGVSAVPGGGADTATEAEHIYDIGGARTKRKRRRYLSFLTAVANRHRDYLREFAEEGSLVVVPDVDGRPLTLAYGRAAFDGEIMIEVVGGGGAAALSPVKQKLMVDASGLLLNKFGPQFDRVFLRQLLTMFDFRDINSLMRAAMVAMAPPPGPPALPTGGSLEDASTPQAIRAGINALNE